LKRAGEDRRPEIIAEETMLRLRSFFAVVLSAGVMLCAVAQLRAAQDKKDAAAAAAGQTSAAAPAANPKDVQNLDAMVAAIYDVISGPPGARDWSRFNSLFTKDARLIAVRVPKAGGKPSLVVMTPQDYADKAGSYFLEHGFFEHELSRKTDSFGAMTHIYTTYESRETKDGKPIDRGINSMEFFNDGERWWCVEIYWDAERPDNPIPEKYLAK
jgi:hypothetical protein